MRFFHISDLHFGKTIYKVSLIEDQEYWIDQFVNLADKEKVDAVVIAGDVYDRAAPGDEAVRLLDKMLTLLSDKNIPVMMVAGNHDSSQKLAFGNRLLKKQGVHISNPLENSKIISHYTMNDEYGPVTFWLMPYVYPTLIGKSLNNEELKNQSFDSAVRALLAEQPVDFTQRNVLVAHQNVTNNGKEAERGGSETSVGGVGQIDYTAFDGFDYVALGHIHSSYHVGKQTVRYAGTPMCYHFNETKQPEKGSVLVEMGAKGQKLSTKVITIPPLHKMREIDGEYETVRTSEQANKTECEYIKVVITDQAINPKIHEELQALFNNRHSILMEISSSYNRPSGNLQELTLAKIEEKSIEELFSDFFTERNGDRLDKKDMALLRFASELQTDCSKDNEDRENDLLAYLKKQEENQE